MAENKPEYLPLFDQDGKWAERPDLLTLAALSTPTKIDMTHAYFTMIVEERNLADQAGGDMSGYAARMKRGTLRGDLTKRILAGSVVLEFVRLAQAAGKPPTLNAARRLVAFNQKRHFPGGTPESALREVEKALSRYRSTIHLQAAAVYDPNLIQELEGSEKGLRRFLGIARAFEEFIDANVVSNTFFWEPLRVPTQIPALSNIEFSALTSAEIKAAGMT